MSARRLLPPRTPPRTATAAYPSTAENIAVRSPAVSQASHGLIPPARCQRHYAEKGSHHDSENETHCVDDNESEQ